MNQAISAELVQEFDLGSARGGKAGQGRAPLIIEPVRALTEADLPAITNPPPVSAPVPVVQALRHSHHRLAQLLAEGKPQVQISQVTGYSQSYISNIQHDPAFAELVQYYTEQRNEIFVDVQERLKLVGLDAVGKLHDQLNDPTAVWSKRELMEVIDLALPQAGKGGGQSSGATSPVVSASLEVKFVGVAPASGPVVEASYTEVSGAQ